MVQTVTSNDASPGPADIDETDRRTLTILRTDDRVALSETARRLDVGSAMIRERTNDLEERGYIREYRTVLDPETLGSRGWRSSGSRPSPGGPRG